MTKRADSVSSGALPASKDLIKLRIQFCGGWGYDRFVQALEEAIDIEFPGMVEIEPIKDIGITGNFEITLMQTNMLLHSKTSMGLGMCDLADERQRLFGLIRIYMKYIEKKKAKKLSST